MVLNLIVLAYFKRNTKKLRLRVNPQIQDLILWAYLFIKKHATPAAAATTTKEE